jgi:esterase/lipase superfamily enzyme
MSNVVAIAIGLFLLALSILSIIVVVRAVWALVTGRKKVAGIWPVSAALWLLLIVAASWYRSAAPAERPYPTSPSEAPATAAPAEPRPAPAPTPNTTTTPSTAPPPTPELPPTAGAPSKAAPPKGSPTPTANVQVFFGTDRRLLSTTRAVFANDESSGTADLTLGWCMVSVPRLHHHIGQIERPTFWTIHISDWRENPDRHFVIGERLIVPPESFWPVVQGVVNRGAEKQLLLFVHGYNVSFDDAVYRTAQLAFDLNFRGAPVLYSWPSNGVTLGYVSDKDRSIATIGSFKRFLIDLSARSGAKTIHVIAHSMGNNSLVHALAELSTEQPANARRFRQLIMAAPDVYRREFLRLADLIQGAADHITLYAADNDRALGASESLHGEARIGDAKPMFLRQGIDSIDASAVIKGFLKHSYFADERILDDIERLIAGQDKFPRFGLFGIPTDERAEYWRFR